MHISKINQNASFLKCIIKTLNTEGIKYRSQKKKTKEQFIPFKDKPSKKLFKQHIHLLEFTSVELDDGITIEIPKFLEDTCKCMDKGIETEGIFRKAGSTIRQKEIQISLDKGNCIIDNYNVIDIANIVKRFLRELPEPLIPNNVQESFLHCAPISEKSVRAVLLTCLLLPTISLNTLSYLMKFLYRVSLHSEKNKMSSKNLAIIITPSLTQLQDINKNILDDHVNIIKLLIENSNSIGMIPTSILEKLQLNVVSPQPYEPEMYKKKKRRSEIFSRIFGPLGGSLESPENTSDSAKKSALSNNLLANDQESQQLTQIQQLQQLQQIQQQSPHINPQILDNQKRKIGEPVCAFSAKKKKDLFCRLPTNSGGLLPNIPLTKESKKSRLSIGNGTLRSDDRRFSIGQVMAKQKNKFLASTRNNANSTENIFEEQLKSEMEIEMEMEIIPATRIAKENLIVCKKVKQRIPIQETKIDGSFQQHNNGIDKRVAEMKKNFTRDLSAALDTPIELSNSLLTDELSGPELVSNEFQRTMRRTAPLRSTETDQLAQRFGNELKIRRTASQKLIRPPSVRIISSIRRRSKDNRELKRSSSYVKKPSKVGQVTAFPTRSTQTNNDIKDLTLVTNETSAKIIRMLPGKSIQSQTSETCQNEFENENWVSGECYFSNTKRSTEHIREPSHQPSIMQTPLKSRQPVQVDKTETLLTPMLPPKIIPIPASMRSARSALKVSHRDFEDRLLTPMADTDSVNSRESIARLRTQNAGQVMAKAKLFDGMGHCISTPINSDDYALIARRKSCYFRSTANIAADTIDANVPTTSRQLLSKIIPEEVKQPSTLKTAVQSANVRRITQRAKSSPSIPIKKKRSIPLSKTPTRKSMSIGPYDNKPLSRNIKNLRASERANNVTRSPKLIQHPLNNSGTPKRLIRRPAFTTQTTNSMTHYATKYRNSPRYVEPKRNQ